jgi:glycosyltransferase involved in cell wall biosynthesis
VARILFWSGDTTSACTFYRCAEPARVLKRLGHETRCDRRVGLATAAMSDVVVIQRPTESTTTHLIEKMLTLPERARPRIVVELDDDLFAIPGHNPAHEMMADPARRERLAWAIAHADRVTVTGEHLAQQTRLVHGAYEWAGDIRVVPNYVPERFVVAQVPEAGRAPTITWAGSDTHRRDFDEVAVPLRKLLRERTDFRVRIVGAPYAVRLETAMSAQERKFQRVAQVPWVEGVDRYIPTLAGHIGLAPLADDLFNRSKSDLRLKELAARGMAVVASDVGPYRASEVPRLLAVPRDWFQLLRETLDDPDFRAAHASRALIWAQANTLEAHAVEWEKTLLD